MLSTLAIAIGMAQAAPYTLVYVARFYKPGKAKSRFEVYLSSSDGKQKLILPSKEEPNQAQWVGKNQIAFTTSSGIWLGSLEKWAPKLIQKGGEVHFKDSRWRIHEPGNPEVELDYEQTEYYQIDSQSSKLIVTQATPDEGMIQLGETPVEVPNPNEPMKPFMLTQFENFDYDIEGKRKTSEYEAQYAVASPNRKEVWIYCGTHSSTSGDVNSLLYLKESERPRMIFSEANSFDFWKKRSIFAYCTTRTTVPFQGKQVWASQLHVGDWKKGTDTTLLKGPVWISSISIRPGTVK